MSNIDPARVRILYTRSHYLVLGPLGCFYVGQNLTLPVGEVCVTSIDPDGAAVARPVELIAQLVAEGRPPVAGWRSSPCYDPSFTSQAGRDGMDAQCERNRRENGVVLPA